jgi:hypothetical protein
MRREARVHALEAQGLPTDYCNTTATVPTDQAARVATNRTNKLQSKQQCVRSVGSTHFFCTSNFSKCCQLRQASGNRPLEVLVSAEIKMSAFKT